MDVLVNVEMTIVVDHKGSTIQGFRAPVLKVGQDVTANVREDLNVSLGETVLGRGCAPRGAEDAPPRGAHTQEYTVLVHVVLFWM